jgi:glycerol kinase
MKSPLVLGLDLGTTGTRAVVYDSAMHVVHKSYVEFESSFPQLGWVEQDPMAILASTRQVLSSVLSRVDRAQIAGVGITNQRETVIMWDVETGVPVYPAIVWQCRRTDMMCEALSESAEFVRERTGLPLDPYFSATKIRWLLDNVSETAALLADGRLRVGTVDTWIMWQLSGRRIFATDMSNASRTSLFNIHTLAYDAELGDLFGVPLSILPEVKASDAVFGYLDNEWGVTAPICAVMGDQQAALYAQCGDDERLCKNTYGTGLFVVRPSRLPVATKRLVTTVAWQIQGQTMYALEGSVFVGGSLIAWIRDVCGWIDDSVESNTLAQSVADTNGVIFVGALSGLGAPFWKPRVKGTVLGLTRGTTKAHMVRAALESLACRTWDVISDMKASLPDAQFASLRVDGGASQNPFLMQFQADMLGVPVELPEDTESTVRGVAGLAAITIGVLAESDFRNLNSIVKRYVPVISELDREQVLAKWSRAVAFCESYYGNG